MRQPNSKQVAKLTEKLKTQRDITEQEADAIRSLFLRDFAKTKLEPESPEFDRELFGALMKFADVATDLTIQEKPGIFLSSFPNLPPNPSYYVGSDLHNTILRVKAFLPEKDTVSIFNICFDSSANGKNHAERTNRTDIFKDTEQSSWEYLDCDTHSSVFRGYRPDYLGFFRRNNINQAFENYARVSFIFNSSVYHLDPFTHYSAEFFFKHAGHNVIRDYDILFCAVMHFINSKEIPFFVYGHVYSVRQDMDPEECEYENYIAVDTELKCRIAEAVQENGAKIIAEMKERGAIYPLTDSRYINSKISEIEECTGSSRIISFVGDPSEDGWYGFNSYRGMLNLASRLLEETLKYGKTIEQVKDEAEEEDIWIAEGR